MGLVARQELIMLPAVREAILPALALFLHLFPP
jgi:hypothetical protein